MCGVELSVLERILLLNLLPREGDFKSLKIVRNLKEDLGFSEDELKALEFKQEGTQTMWRTEADAPKDIPIGEFAHALIADTLRELDKNKKLNEQIMSLYEKFVVAKDE